MGASAWCPSGDKMPDNTIACTDTGRFGVSPRQACILLPSQGSGCKIFCVKQGLLEGERELRSCLPSTHRHGDALNPWLLHNLDWGKQSLSPYPTGELPLYLVGHGSGFQEFRLPQAGDRSCPGLVE